MAERSVDIDTTKTSSASGIVSDAEKAKSEETRAEKKARLARVLNRGIVGDHLRVALPPDIHGEWVPNHEIAIQQKRALGFEIDTQYAKGKGMHDKGDSATHIVDVVFMTCSKEHKELLDEIKAEKFKEMHAPKGGKQKEEKDFVRQSDAETVPSANSNVAQVGPQNIADALKAAAQQH